MHASCWYSSHQAVSVAISAVCVAGSVLPSPTTGSRMQGGFFMSTEWSDRFCNTFTDGIFEMLLRGWLTHSQAFVYLHDVITYND